MSIRPALPRDPRILQIAFLSAFLATGVAWLGFELPLWQPPLIIATALGTQWVLTHLTCAPPSGYRSPLISSLGLSLLLRTDVPWIPVLAAFAAIASKFIIRFRGKHILKTREDGTLKCVACYMCQQACPAECITIVAGEHPKISYEKYPVVFDIDMLRCVFCGFCVDACPKDSIWMTRDYELAFFNRQQAIFGIDKLIEKPGVPVKDGYGYRPYYPGDGTVPPTDSSTTPVIPGDGERSDLRGRLPVYRPPTPILAAKG